MPAPATSQTAEQDAQSNAPAAQPVGPRELQNFNLPGTVTRRTEQPPEPAQTTQPPPRTAPATVAPAPQPRRAAPPPEPSREPERAAPRAAEPAPEAIVPLPLPVEAAPIAPAPAPETRAAPPAAEPETSILPWLLAALALAGGVAFLLWRKRPREALADGPPVSQLVAEPARAPAPAPPPPSPAPRPAPRPAAPAGIISTGLRPELELSFQPLRCSVDDEQVIIEFQLELLNSGKSPARSVVAEASWFNAGPNQDQDIAAFFARPNAQGQEGEDLLPLKRIAMRSQVIAPRAVIQEYELGGRRAFVPLIAFNAVYRWTGGEGQVSAAYLLGRDTPGDKLGPFRLDLGPRAFTGLVARQLPATVRR